jgi:thymidylate synthase
MTVRDILNFGEWQEDRDVRAKWEDGTPAPAKSIIGLTLKYDNTEVPALTNKKLGMITAVRELIWIWFMKSNKLKDLQAMGVTIWNKWEIKEGKWKGTIGPAYGYQLGKKCRKFAVDKLHREHLDPNGLYEEIDGFVMLDQVDFLIQSLLNNPGSRRLVTTLIAIEDLDDMELEPCVWKTKWIYHGKKLNVTVGVRSNDICVGNPFNVFQYYMLQRIICHILGFEMGTIQFDIDDAHIYDRHIDTVMEQIQGATFPAPTITLNPELKNFYDFKVSDMVIEGYRFDKSYNYEVAE